MVESAGQVATWLGQQALTFWDSQRVKALVPEFPRIFDQAVEDWAKFKEGVKAGAFTSSQREEVLSWFKKFPQLWETIRPNFIKDEAGLEWGGKVDNFIGRLLKDPLYSSGQLGIPPALVAGVLIVGGAAAALWALGYVKRQQNISAMIEGVTSGKVPPEVLKKAIEEEHKGGLFGSIADIVKIGAIGAAVLFVGFPLLKRIR